MEPMLMPEPLSERTTGFAFLGDATEPYDEPRPCHMTGEPTVRRVLLAKTY
jgi:hypothetical protein